MRATLLAIAAATLMAGAVPVSSASAQGVTVEGPGVGVRVGEPDRYRERRWREEHYRDRDRVTIGGEGCRTVIVKERLPDGTVVKRKRSSC